MNEADAMQSLFLEKIGNARRSSGFVAEELAKATGCGTALPVKAEMLSHFHRAMHLANVAKDLRDSLEALMRELGR